MGTIAWSTDVNAPCCPGEIVNDDGRTLLIQNDFECPSVAGTFGWSTRFVQKCPACGSVSSYDDLDLNEENPYCAGISSCRVQNFSCCLHDGTDGTVDCKECGITASQFISDAYDWLRENDGAEVDDPGYFTESADGRDSEND